VTRLSAIVPATNEPPTLDRCVAAIRTAEEPPEEVIVVSEAPAPGPAAARNEGAARATGDVLVFVDADVVVHPDAFRRIRRAFDADAELAALFGSYDDDPEDPGVVSAFRNLLHHHVHHSAAGPASTFWAGLGAIRREAFAAVGGFDAGRYPHPSVEDIDLGLRLAEARGRIRLDPDLQGQHLRAWTLVDMIHTDFARRGVPWLELLLERGVAPTPLNLGWRHRLSAFAVLALVASIAGRRRGRTAAATLALLVLNADFYRLLLRRRGPRSAAAGVGLHALHHLTGAAAIPVALWRLRRRRTGFPAPQHHREGWDEAASPTGALVQDRSDEAGPDADRGRAG
jgi:Glycosyl transferase family 2